MKRLFVALIAVSVLAIPAQAHAGWKGWKKIGRAITAPIRVPVERVAAFVEEPSLKNAGKALISPIEGPIVTVENVLGAANDAVEDHPKVQKALDGKQVVVFFPVGSPTAPPPSNSVPSAATAPAQSAVAADVSRDPANVGVSTPMMGAHVAVTVVPGETHGDNPEVTVIFTPVPTPLGLGPGRVYGPSQIGVSTPENSQPAPQVPQEHPNLEKYFDLEGAVELAAKNLSLPSPEISSAYRTGSTGHMRAALDVKSTNEALAKEISAILGPKFFVQVELVNTPSEGLQTLIKFRGGQYTGTEEQKLKATGNHIHVQMDADAIQ